MSAVTRTSWLILKGLNSVIKLISKTSSFNLIREGILIDQPLKELDALEALLRLETTKKIFGFPSVSDRVPQLRAISFQNHFGYVEKTVCQYVNW